MQLDAAAKSIFNIYSERDMHVKYEANILHYLLKNHVFIHGSYPSKIMHINYNECPKFTYISTKNESPGLLGHIFVG